MRYGKEVALDVRDADPSKFTRDAIEDFMVDLCGALGLVRGPLYFWDYENPDEKAEAPPHLKGTTAVQFVTTSSIVIHTLDDLRSVFLNVFACGEVSYEVVKTVTLKHFGGDVPWWAHLHRGEHLS